MSFQVEIDGREVVASGTILLQPKERSVRFTAGDDTYTLHIAHYGEVPTFPDDQEEDFRNGTIDVGSVSSSQMGISGTHWLHATLTHALDNSAPFFILHYTIKGPPVTA